MLKMALELARVDYTLLGLTSPQCMKLLPSAGQKATQKVVVGDHEGVVQLFSLKKGEIQVGFKTLPGDKITRVQLGGALGTAQDKIFVSSKNEVRGYTKKGKLFLGFDTNLTESIKSMYVSGNDLFVAGTHVYNHYRDCKDTNAFLCGDKINDLITLNYEKLHRVSPVLACEDRMLRVLDNSSLSHTFGLPSAPTVLHPLNNDGGCTGDQLLYGTEDGCIGLVQITRTSVIPKWVLDNSKHRGGIQCIHCYDMTGDGVLDLIVGRQDGGLQIYSIPTDEVDDTQPPMERFSYMCNESITSVQGGIFANTGFDEVLATTYTGWFFGLTTEVIDKQVTGDTGDLNTKICISNDEKLKIVRLRTEIEEIEQKVIKEREKYQNATQEDSAGFSTIPYLAVNDKMVLSKEDAVYHLTIEVETAIDNVLIQSDVPVELLDVEKNSAVVSRSTCYPNSGNCLLATYRCQMNTTRLELRIRTSEGPQGTLLAYITPILQPKCCQVRRYQIKPLSLHTRAHAPDLNRTYNTLTLKGGFSLAEIHAWVSLCLPEVPEKPPVGDKAVYYFTSAFINTMLQCTYGKGEAEFRADNVSTISVLRDVITKEATKKKIKIDILCEVNDESTPSVLRMLHSKLESEVKLAKEVQLLEALRDLETYEGESMIQCLIAEYREILKNEKQLLARFNKQPGYLDRLFGAVTDMYVDWYKFKGINVKSKVPLLLEVLHNYNLDDILNFFQV